MILVDASPLQTEHRYRGPGTYTAGLLDALTRLPLPEPLGLLAESPHSMDLPLLADLLRRDGVHWVPLRRPARPRYRFAWLVSSVAVTASLWRARPRLYHATEPNGLARPPVPSIATVAMLHDLIPLRHPEAHFPWRRFDQRVGYARYLRLLQRADRLVVNSEATKRDAVERLRIPSERVTVTPLAVDERRFYPRSPREIDAVVHRYELRRPYMLHVGASTYHKNSDRILRAFERFGATADGREHALYIVGRWTPRALAALHHSYPALIGAGRLRVLGFVPDDDLPALYGGADALVYPSLIEGFGLPVLEAMRCGTPVITSINSSLPEVGGTAALYVDPLDLEAIAAALQRLSAEPALRADLAARGLRQAAHFTWVRTAEATLQVYRELL